jgi:hypothetical protein
VDREVTETVAVGPLMGEVVEDVESRPCDFADARALLMGACPHVGALIASPGEVRGGGEPLEVGDLERLSLVGPGQILIGPAPRLPVEGVSASVDPVAHANVGSPW